MATEHDTLRRMSLQRLHEARGRWERSHQDLEELLQQLYFMVCELANESLAREARHAETEPTTED